MKAIAVIPARLGATRFPAKPLAKETGKYLVQHVYEQVRQCCCIQRVIVATDDERIVAAVHSFGGDVCMTRPDHASGTDRVGEVAAGLALADDDLVLNVQGDEPEIHPSVLDRLIERFDDIAAATASSCENPFSHAPVANIPPRTYPRIATVAVQFPDDGPKEGPGSPLDPNRVKVVCDHLGRAMYFSRSLIPFPRSSGGRAERPSDWWLHLGVYAFRADVLRRITSKDGLRRGGLEETESLEQLRWLQAGLSIAVVPVDHAFTGVDTPEDYAAFVRRYRGRKGL